MGPPGPPKTPKIQQSREQLLVWPEQAQLIGPTHLTLQRQVLWQPLGHAMYAGDDMLCVGLLDTRCWGPSMSAAQIPAIVGTRI